MCFVTLSGYSRIQPIRMLADGALREYPAMTLNRVYPALSFSQIIFNRGVATYVKYKLYCFRAWRVRGT